MFLIYEIEIKNYQSWISTLIWKRKNSTKDKNAKEINSTRTIY